MKKSLIAENVKRLIKEQGLKKRNMEYKIQILGSENI